MRLLCLLLFAMWHTVVGFPMGRCYVRNCDSSPYKLVMTEKTWGRICFRVDGKACVDTSSRYTCCANFANVLNKIVLATQPMCNTSLARVTMNDGAIVKGGGVFFDLYNNSVDGTLEAEVRITSLRLSYNAAVSTSVCLHLQGICEDPNVFCGGSVCRNAFFDPLGHTCCPTCSIEEQANPSTPTPPPAPLRRPPPRAIPVANPPQIIRISPPPPSPRPTNTLTGILIGNQRCNCSCS